MDVKKTAAGMPRRSVSVSRRGNFFRGGCDNKIEITIWRAADSGGAE